MKIACIGWGSLIWNPGVLRVAGEWHTDGPALPVEFARVSRDGRLTLVLTPGAKPVETLWCELDYGSADAARAALAGREGCAVHAIGLWPGSPPRHRVGAEAIELWARQVGIDVVVWTALGPRFNGDDGRAPATADDAVRYVAGLGEGARATALAYVRRAPAQVQTVTRAAIEAAFSMERDGEGDPHAA